MLNTKKTNLPAKNTLAYCLKVSKCKDRVKNKVLPLLIGMTKSIFKPRLQMLNWISLLQQTV